MATKAYLEYDGKKIALPVIIGTENEVAIDISKLRSKTGLITLDKGFKNTGSTTSKITYLDGEKGILRHRGYSIEDLASKSTFTEVCYLLIYGNLPSSNQLLKFETKLKEHTLVHEDFKIILDGFPSNAHPMGILSSLITSLTAFYPKSIDPNRSGDKVDLSIIRMLSKFPTFVAWSYKKRIGHPIVYPDNNLDYCSNFLKMMFKMPTENYDYNPLISDVLNKLLILHADHEQNCSTSSVRLSGSSGTNPYAAMSSGVAALWGPLHGGANEAVVRMFDEIKTVDRIGHFMDKAKDHDDPFRLMGFGHRVYKNYDPRAAIIKETCHTVLGELDQTENPIFELALTLEEIALNDEYFVEHNLYPNVDFYSGIIYKAMGIPLEMFTVMFTLSRTVGWATHWCEMMSSPKTKIGRPRQLYTGPTERDYIPVEKR